MQPLSEMIASAVLPIALAASSQAGQAGASVASEPDPYAPGVGRMVRSIVQYTRWPDRRRTIRLCIVEPSDHADAILPYRLSNTRSLAPVRMAANAVSATRCDVIYLGRMSVARQREITQRVRNEAVLTIAENDPACRGRAMICLLFEAKSLSFRLNTDAISRSKVRVDPRVLRLGMGGSS